MRACRFLELFLLQAVRSSPTRALAVSHGMSSAQLEGWVLKEGKINGWKKRWCVVGTEQVLFWGAQGGAGKPKDSVALDSVREVADDDGIIAIRTSTRNIHMNPIGTPTGGIAWS